MNTILVHLQSLPPHTPPDSSLYLAGSFNRWRPDDRQYRFQAKGDGSYQAQIQTALDLVEYKITRGAWHTAEGDASGCERPNRVFKPGPGVNDLWVEVASWTDLPPAPGGPAAPGNAVLLHPQFYMPQLGRYRRIWACLPPDYWSGARRHPVVYMQDGQNLFDNPEAHFGSWGVDRALNRLFLRHQSAAAGRPGQPILIGIENGGPERIQEYSPWQNPEYGGGQGEQYLDFICNTLKPFVDQRLRTLPDREYTGVAGSSMGGLMALYAAVERPDIFGMAGVFSPSLWFSSAILPFVLQKKATWPVRMLLMAGQQESATMVSELLDLYETLLAAGHSDENLHYDLHSDGAHSEWFWAREFEHALSWLFGDMPGHTRGISSEWIDFRLDETAKQLLVKVDARLQQPRLEVRDYCHDRRFDYTLQGTLNRIPYAEWEECLYAIRLLSGGDLVFSRRVHLNQVASAPFAVPAPEIPAVVQHLIS